MKPCNVVKKLKSGWMVGLSDNNHIIAETPEGDVFQPYEGPGNKLFGTTLENKTITLNEEVAKLVRHLWARKHEAEELAQAAREDEIERLARELTGEESSNDSLEDYGFDGDDTIHIEEM